MIVYISAGKDIGLTKSEVQTGLMRFCGRTMFVLGERREYTALSLTRKSGGLYNFGTVVFIRGYAAMISYVNHLLSGIQII